MSAIGTMQAELTPVVIVPRHDLLQRDIRDDAHRYLVASDGVYLEITRPWLHARALIAPTFRAFPFGAVEPVVTLLTNPVPRALFDEFIEHARAAMPNEESGIMIWNRTTGQYRLQITSVEANRSNVAYALPRLDTDEYRVVDIHSHGHYAAGFSRTDDIDDQHEVKISVVIGNIDSAKLSVAARYCIMGMFIKMETLC